MKIICGLGTAVRFAVACFVVGALLGFLLASSWHAHRPSGVSVADPHAHVRAPLLADQMLDGTEIRQRLRERTIEPAEFSPGQHRRAGIEVRSGGEPS